MACPAAPLCHALAGSDIGQRAPRPSPLGPDSSAGLWSHAAVLVSVQAPVWSAGSKHRVTEEVMAPGLLT